MIPLPSDDTDHPIRSSFAGFLASFLPLHPGFLREELLSTYFFSSYSIAVSCHKHHSNNYVSPIYVSCPNLLPQASHYISYYLLNILNKYFFVHISSLDLFTFCLQPGFPSNIMPKALNKFKPQTKMVFFIPLFVKLPPMSYPPIHPHTVNHQLLCESLQ